MTLEKRRIGKTDIEVTTLGFGGAPIGGADVSPEEMTEIIQRAREGGICYFDTAPLYGKGVSEKRIGEELAQVPRSEYVLSTKVGRLVALEEGSPHALTIQYDYSYEGARRSLEASFERLGLDRVDIVYCHDIDIWTHGDGQPEIFETAVKGILPALQDLRNEGVIRAFGLGVNEAPVCSQIMDLFDVDCFLLAGRFTLLEQDPLDHLLPKCLENNVSIIIGGPYNSGLLATAQREQATYDYKPVGDALWEKAQKIRQICEIHGVDVRTAALQYPLLHPAVASVIPGSISLTQLEENLELFHRPIPPALWSDLDAVGLARGIA